ncbi:MAG: hypothetical protein ACT4P6_03125 [Gemmatimonadaceae bacterium]
MLLRLDTPSPGIALVGTSDAANLGGSAGTNVSLCRYFYGDGAVALAAESEASWRDWLTKTFDTQEVTGA